MPTDAAANGVGDLLKKDCGSTVARLAALAANAVRACDLVRALAVLDEIQPRTARPKAA